MQINNVTQNTPEWLALRRQCFTASEASAMLGMSKYLTRSELLRQKATGITPEVDANKQFLFDKGHAAEAAARPLAEAIAGKSLLPLTGTLDINGLKLLASFDGITLDERLIWESKMPNAALAAYLVTFHDLPDTHWPQVEQQLLISGAARCLFTVADTKIHAQLYYTSRPHRQLELLAGWQQFSEDLANYVHSEPIAAAVAAPIKQLPALIVQLSGAVESSNIALYRDAALEMIESINVELKTDDDFANAESMVKFCDAAEKELDTVKRQAIAQTATIDELFRSVDLLKELMRNKRLMLDKLVKARKESIKIEVMRDAQDKLRKHINGLNNRLVSVQMPFVPEDFAGVMKG